MSLPFRRRSRPRFNGSPSDHAVTEQWPAQLRTDDADGATFELSPAGTTPFSGVAAPLPEGVVPAAAQVAAELLRAGRAYGWDDIPEPAAVKEPGPDAQPLALLRAQPRYQPQQPPPAGYAATTGPMPAVGRPAVSIGDALTRDETWGPKLAPVPCGHCGTPPPVPDGILDRTRIIGHVNWLAAQAGWKYDTDLILTCPPCQQHDAWRARQGQVEVRWPDSGYCDRHDADDPDAWCACPATVLAVDVMLASWDYLNTGRDISIQYIEDAKAGRR